MKFHRVILVYNSSNNYNDIFSQPCLLIIQIILTLFAVSDYTLFWQKGQAPWLALIFYTWNVH